MNILASVQPSQGFMKNGFVPQIERKLLPDSLSPKYHTRINTVVLFFRDTICVSVENWDWQSEFPIYTSAEPLLLALVFVYLPIQKQSIVRLPEKTS